MAEFTVDTEVALILVHELVDLVSGYGFGKNLEIRWIGTWPSGRSRGLRRGSRGGSVLRQSKVSRKRSYAHYDERASTEPIHSGQYLFYEDVECVN